MNIKDALKELIIRIDSSETTNSVLAILQLLAAVSIGVYTIYAESQTVIPRLSVCTFWICQMIVLSYFLGMLFFSGRYRAIKLRLKRNTGFLYDATTYFRNVSLRVESLNIILDGLKDGENAYKVGKKVGENFYSAFEQDLHRKGKNYTPEDKLKRWLDYDSSSGIGKFEALPHNGLWIKLKISSLFIGACPDQESNPRCRLFIGYIDGFCSKLYNEELKSRCDRKQDPSFCILTLEPVD